jgi:hypothetical protein
VRSGFVADGELVVPGGDCPVAVPRHGAACRGPGRRPAADRPSTRACVGWRPGLPWTGSLPRYRVDAGRVALAGGRPSRPGSGRGRVLGPATAEPGHPDTFDYRDDLRAVAPLPGGQHDRQRLLPLLAAQMRLGGQPAARPTPTRDRPARRGSRRAVRPAGPPFTRSGGRPMRAGDGRVMRPAASAKACNTVRIRAQVPSRCQRRNKTVPAAQDP